MCAELQMFVLFLTLPLTTNCWAFIFKLWPEMLHFPMDNARVYWLCKDQHNIFLFSNREIKPMLKPEYTGIVRI